MSGSLMSHNFKTIDFTVIFTTNIYVPAISDNTFVSAIIHNTFATIPLSTIPYTGVPVSRVSLLTDFLPNAPGGDLGSISSKPRPGGVLRDSLWRS